MLILLAPSEEKKSFSTSFKISSQDCIQNSFKNSIDSLTFKINEQKKFLNLYLNLLKTNPEKIFCSNNPNNISKFYNLHGTDLIPAIERYQGVLFKAFNLNDLTRQQQEIAKKHIVIFSNLFGALLAGDLIPYYKLKQGVKLDNTLEKTYNNFQSGLIEKYISRQKIDFILDLRAKYYISFFTPKTQVINIDILKNGKTISHSSKYYRGIIAREYIKLLANNSPQKNSDKLECLYNLLKTHFNARCTFIKDQFRFIVDFKD